MLITLWTLIRLEQNLKALFFIWDNATDQGTDGKKAAEQPFFHRFEALKIVIHTLKTKNINNCNFSQHNQFVT